MLSVNEGGWGMGGERAMEMQHTRARPRLSVPGETAKQHGM